MNKNTLQDNVLKQPIDLTAKLPVTEKVRGALSVRTLLRSQFIEQCEKNRVVLYPNESLVLTHYEIRRQCGKKVAENAWVPCRYFFPSYVKDKVIGCRLFGDGFELRLEDCSVEEQCIGMHGIISYRLSTPLEKIEILKEGLLAYREACLR